MTTEEKRAAILEMAEPTLRYFMEWRALDLLEHGSAPVIEDAWTRFFKEAWERNQKAAVDKAGGAGV